MEQVLLDIIRARLEEEKKLGEQVRVMITAACRSDEAELRPSMVATPRSSSPYGSRDSAGWGRQRPWRSPRARA